MRSATSSSRQSIGPLFTYDPMEQLADQGKSSILNSSEMPELLGMADRVYVMCNGKITGEIDQKEDMTQEKVMSFATQF